MIGQKHLLELIDAMQFQLPHFIILVGPRGSGKTCLTKYKKELVKNPFVSFKDRSILKLAVKHTKFLQFLYSKVRRG